MVIRPPEREKKLMAASNNRKPDPGDTVSTPVSLRSPAGKEPEFLLYVNVRKCKHSLEILDILSHTQVNFKPIDVSKMASIPTWLTGTPVVLYNGKGYCGDSAFEFVSRYSQQSKESAPSGFESSKSDDNKGCGFAQAFKPPVDESSDSKYAESSTDDRMKQLLSGRR